MFGMQGFSRRILLRTTLLASLAGGLFACAGAADSPRRADWDNSSRVGLSPDGAIEDKLVATTFIDARPAALINGKVVQWSELRPLLNEAAGATVLQEVILDRMLADELNRSGVAIHPDEVDRERELFYATLDPDPDVAVRLARELRARQGLGPRRLDRLLRRNAGLRALVAEDVVVSEDAVVRTYRILHGPTARARLIVVPTLAAAQAAYNRIKAGDFFGEVAVEVSTDVSAARGGMLSPISPDDPTYPEVMRDTLSALKPGEVSSPIFLSRQYALLMLVEQLDGDGVELADERSRIEQQVRLNQERLLMDMEARRLLSQATVTIIDAALQDAWDARAAQGRRQAGR